MESLLDDVVSFGEELFNLGEVNLEDILSVRNATFIGDKQSGANKLFGNKLFCLQIICYVPQLISFWYFE